jgi:hypothetical protein
MKFADMRQNHMDREIQTSLWTRRDEVAQRCRGLKFADPLGKSSCPACMERNFVNPTRKWSFSTE